MVTVQHSSTGTRYVCDDMREARAVIAVIEGDGGSFDHAEMDRDLIHSGATHGRTESGRSIVITLRPAEPVLYQSPGRSLSR